ncbi:hypothetical protein Leryth_006909 [Lithospermum erythrorhizon]|nr:hypothetical protein Leryth_006909 [Lithospermum erythrorhizon]
MGNKWSQMARCLPGRTDNEIKNHWHTNLKKGRRNNDGFITLTDVDAKKCISTHENNPPTSITTIPYACSNESFGKTDVSLAYTDQALSNLPKVFFAEWVTIDQTHGEVVQSNLGNPLITRDLQEEYKTNFQNSSMQSLLLSEEMLYESILNGIQNSSTYGVFYPTLASKCT